MKPKKAPKGRGAWMAKVGEKGQIVIPKEARDMFGIEPGDTLMLLGDEKKGLAVLSGEKMMQMTSLIFEGPETAADTESEENS